MLINEPPRKKGKFANTVMFLIIAILAVFLGYFYNKSKTVESNNSKQTAAKTTAIDTTKPAAPTLVAGETTTIVSTTTPVAIPVGKDFWAKFPSKPNNIYIVQKGDTLFPIAKKFTLSWETIAAANGMTEPDKIKIDQPLVIPKMDDKTKLPFVEFAQNADVLAKAPTGKRDDPVAVVKNELGSIFGISTGDEFTAKSSDKTAGVAVVKKLDGKIYNYQVNLIKPSQAGWENSWIIEKISAQ